MQLVVYEVTPQPPREGALVVRLEHAIDVPRGISAAAKGGVQVVVLRQRQNYRRSERAKMAKELVTHARSQQRD